MCAARVLMCHTQLDFGVFCEQNILSLNVSVDHMMGVEMGKTLERHACTYKHGQMTAATIDVESHSRRLFIVRDSLNESETETLRNNFK